MRLQKTRRKFYGKWIYKVSFAIEGACIFRIYSLNDIPSILENKKSVGFSYIENAKKNKELILSLTNFLKLLDAATWFKRIERNNIDIYTNDKGIFQNLQNLPLKIRLICDPGNNVDYLDQNIILAKKYPHKEFKYRVYLSPHKVKDVSEKKSYINWLEQQKGVKISDSVKSWFINTNWNWDRRYLLAKNETDLIMLKMRCSDAIGKIYEYQLTDK